MQITFNEETGRTTTVWIDIRELADNGFSGVSPDEKFGSLRFLDRLTAPAREESAVPETAEDAEPDDQGTC